MVIYVVTSNLQKLIWIYCPSHAGVRGKMKVDSLASKELITGRKTLIKLMYC